MNKNLITAIATVGLLLFVLALFQACVATQTSVVSVEPSSQKVSPGEIFTVNITVYPKGNDVFAGGYTLYFDNTLLNATSQVRGPFLSQDGAETWEVINDINNTQGEIKYGEARKDVDYGVTDSGVLATITFQALADGSCELGISDLDGVILANPNYTSIPTEVMNGSVEIARPSRFDTGASDNPNPSILGVHNGTIKPNQTIVANRIYTYSCAGTGGHIEYARIWGNGVNVHANWGGYVGDWHNLSFDTNFTLEPDVEYNYTIHTGSYPQIIHVHSGEYKVTGGKISCTEFVDVNGKRYTGWIPAFRLWREV
jgi:hypothetical protein